MNQLETVKDFLRDRRWSESNIAKIEKQILGSDSPYKFVVVKVNRTWTSAGLMTKDAPFLFGAERHVRQQPGFRSGIVKVFDVSDCRREMRQLARGHCEVIPVEGAAS